MLPLPLVTAAPRRLDVDQRALLDRWDRIGLGVRLGYNPSQPQAIRAFLYAGRLLVRSGVRAEPDVQLRSFGVLLATADDPMLPLSWCEACLEHACLPMARLMSWGRRSARIDPATLQARLEAVSQRLASRPVLGGPIER
jgi:hypothetical protein